MKYITLLLLLLCGVLNAQKDTIILEQTEYQVNDYFRFTVQAKKPTAFGLNGACGGGGLVYKIFKITGSGPAALVYDNTQVIMDCGMPYTAEVLTFSSQLLEGVKQPGQYFMEITAGKRSMYSAVFTIIPLQPRNYYGTGEFRDASSNFANEKYFTQLNVYLELYATGNYSYNYSSILKGSGRYTVMDGATIVFIQDKGENAEVQNPDLLLNGSYHVIFKNGWMILSKINYTTNESYIYQLMPVPEQE